MPLQWHACIEAIYVSTYNGWVPQYIGEYIYRKNREKSRLRPSYEASPLIQGHNSRGGATLAEKILQKR